MATRGNSHATRLVHWYTRRNNRAILRDLYKGQWYKSHSQAIRLPVDIIYKSRMGYWGGGGPLLDVVCVCVCGGGITGCSVCVGGGGVGKYWNRVCVCETPGETMWQLHRAGGEYWHSTELYQCLATNYRVPVNFTHTGPSTGPRISVVHMEYNKSGEKSLNW